VSDTLGPLEIEFLINNPQILAQLRQAGGDFQNFNRTVQQQAAQSGNAIESFAKKAAVAAALFFYNRS